LKFLPKVTGTSAKAMAKAAAVTTAAQNLPSANALREDQGLDLTVYSNWPTILFLMLLAFSIFANGFVLGYLSHYIQNHNAHWDPLRCLRRLRPSLPEPESELPASLPLEDLPIENNDAPADNTAGG
jgi:hypothetical protein